MAFYNRVILPNLIDSSCKQGPIMKQRSKIVPEAEGVVAEIGMGAAPNLQFYDPGKVKALIGIEPNPGMRKKAGRAIEGQPIPIELVEGFAENLPLETGQADTVVLTYTLCSLPDVPGAFSEIRRILKPGGKLLVLEHGAAPDADVFKWQRRLEPVWKLIGGGCHLTRPIDKMVEAGGFRFDHLVTEYVKKTPKFVGYDYTGVARPA